MTGKDAMEDTEIIISGPEVPATKLWGSIAEYVIPRMKKLPKDFIFQVDYGRNETITSYDFLKESLEVAEGLIQLGLKADDVVIHVGSNNIRSFVAAMGIVFSGGVFAPIDQTLRTFEIRHFLNEFKAKFVICEEEEKAKEILSCVKSVNLDVKIILMNSSVRVINSAVMLYFCQMVPSEEFFCWSDIRKNVDVHSYVPRGVTDPKTCVCAINCSSGSTGMPKGVALSHYALLENFEDMEPHCKDIHKFIQTAPLFWMSGMLSLLNGCYFGQTCYFPKSTAPSDLLKAVELSKPSFLFLPPSQILALVKDMNFEQYDVESIRFLASGGSPLNPTIVNKVKKVWGVPILNFYGLTETTGGLICAPGCDNPYAIGEVVPGVEVKVVDVTTGKSLGPNKTGELRVKTKRIMNGYYNNEEATKAAFDENGWFRTGDLVYYDERKVFYFERRTQEVIQYLSYKISPTEIEAFIIGLPGVKDVVVVGVPHETEVSHLRALVVKDPEFDISADEIIQEVKENFTDRKHLRGGVQFVDYFPRTAAGKLRRAEAQKLIQMGK